MQVYKVYLRWLTGTISWWKPPEGTVFNIPLFTGWEQALVKKIPMSWWKKLSFQAVIRFNKWLYPRPKLFKWLNVSCFYLYLPFGRGWQSPRIRLCTMSLPKLDPPPE